ncbi:hypothetical protein diail_10302 [Diaporthe ilicicola]|nr:hypothetical protein diail_10302 [Diaporthe ilicicola]
MFKRFLLILAGAAAVQAWPVPRPTKSLTPAQVEAGCTFDMIPFRPECHVADNQDNTLRVGATPYPTPIFAMGCDYKNDGTIPDCHLHFYSGQVLDDIVNLVTGLRPDETTSYVPTATTVPVPTPTTTTSSVSTDTTTHMPPIITSSVATSTSRVTTTTESSMPRETTSQKPTNSSDPKETETKKPTQTIVSTTTSSTPTPTPTDDADRNVTDVIKTLNPKKDKKALAIGLGVGLGAGIPSVSLVGWLGTNLALAKGQPQIYDEVESVLSDRIPDWMDQVPDGMDPNEVTDPDISSEADISGADDISRPPSRGGIVKNVADSVNEVHNRLRQEDYNANEAEKLLEELGSDMASAESAISTEAGASAVVEAASNLAGIASQGLRTAAEVATSGASPEAISDALIRAGVPAGEVVSTSAAITAAIDTAPKGYQGYPAKSTALKVISKAVTRQSVSAANAAIAATDGASGEALASYLSSAGVPSYALHITAEAVKDAIQGASASGSDPLRAALGKITQASPLGWFGSSSEMSASNTAVSEALLDVLGASYNFWHGYSNALYHTFKKLDSQSHSDTLEKILANGPPPAMQPYRDITFPYHRGGNQSHVNEPSHGKHDKGSDKATSKSSSTQTTTQSSSSTGGSHNKATTTNSSPQPTSQRPSPTGQSPIKAISSSSAAQSTSQSPSPSGKNPEKTTDKGSPVPPEATEPVPSIWDVFCASKSTKELNTQIQDADFLFFVVNFYRSQKKSAYIKHFKHHHKDLVETKQIISREICRFRQDPRSVALSLPPGKDAARTYGERLLEIWSVLSEVN